MVAPATLAYHVRMAARRGTNRVHPAAEEIEAVLCDPAALAEIVAAIARGEASAAQEAADLAAIAADPRVVAACQ